jgi:hypothetical protein
VPTHGSTSEPDYGAEWWGGGVNNQHAQKFTMPETGYITRVGGWLRGKDESCSFRFCVWASDGNLLAQSSLLTASGASFGINQSSNYEGNLTTKVKVNDGASIYVGFSRNPNGQMQFGTNSSGTHYDDYQSGTWPGDATWTSHSRDLGAYFDYITQSETYVRRAGAWVQNQEVYTRRAGAWVGQGAEVYVRRGGVWVPA